MPCHIKSRHVSRRRQDLRAGPYCSLSPHTLARIGFPFRSALRQALNVMEFLGTITTHSTMVTRAQKIGTKRPRGVDAAPLPPSWFTVLEELPSDLGLELVMLARQV